MEFWDTLQHGQTQGHCSIRRPARTKTIRYFHFSSEDPGIVESLAQKEIVTAGSWGQGTEPASSRDRDFCFNCGAFCS